MTNKYMYIWYFYEQIWWEEEEAVCTVAVA